MLNMLFVAIGLISVFALIKIRIHYKNKAARQELRSRLEQVFSLPPQ